MDKRCADLLAIDKVSILQVYLPMSYVWGTRGTCKPSALTEALKNELYSGPYQEIDWNAARSQ